MPVLSFTMPFKEQSSHHAEPKEIMLWIQNAYRDRSNRLRCCLLAVMNLSLTDIAAATLKFVTVAPLVCARKRPSICSSFNAFVDLIASAL